MRTDDKKVFEKERVRNRFTFRYVSLENAREESLLRVSRIVERRTGKLTYRTCLRAKADLRTLN